MDKYIIIELNNRTGMYRQAVGCYSSEKKAKKECDALNKGKQYAESFFCVQRVKVMD